MNRLMFVFACAAPKRITDANIRKNASVGPQPGGAYIATGTEERQPITIITNPVTDSAANVPRYRPGPIAFITFLRSPGKDAAVK